jgi:hypothetical protein
VIIVDDRLSLLALAGRLPRTDVIATTWCFHYRLVRALADPRAGALSAQVTDGVRRVVAVPPEASLVVLDPRTITERAAALATKHRLNLLAAELVAAAVHHGATVRLSEGNVGRHWRDTFAEEGVTLDVT